jgi:branched-chain amino acid transport system ATP-binding protein
MWVERGAPRAPPPPPPSTIPAGRPRVLLTLENVTQRFGELAAVNDLSFGVEEGEVFGIAGPNGAGKTTVFNLISGFLHGSGHVYFDGKRISGLPPHRVTQRGVARTFQIPQPFHSMTVVQNLRMGEYFGADRRSTLAKHAPWNDLADLISFVGLQGKEDRAVTTLKLYDKKLTVLASALATRPRLIMLDEALGGLSAVEAEQSLDLLQRLNREWGLTVLMIEHLMSALTRSCHRLLILNNGEALALGEPKAVVQEPAVIECLVGGKHA